MKGREKDYLKRIDRNVQVGFSKHVIGSVE